MKMMIFNTILVDLLSCFHCFAFFIIESAKQQLNVIHRFDIDKLLN